MTARTGRWWSALVIAGSTVLLSVGVQAQPGAPLNGRWDGVVVASGVEVPFPFEVTGSGTAIQGSFFNGERRITSTEAHVDATGVTFRFGQYGSRLELRSSGDGLTGSYFRARGEPLPVRATRATADGASAASDNPPSIEGTWIVQAKSSKGETAWRFIAHQMGGQVEATILRVDGDTGTLLGGWHDGRFVLSHFSGARPLRLEVTPQADGTLVLSQNGQAGLIAARADTARVAAIGTPTDPAAHTRMKDPAEPFRFSFPNLDGQIVSNTDEKFRGKVLLVNISGSWCPNCHDEAPFLAALYRQYRAKGLEIVTLSFEEGDQLTNPVRLKSFNATYGIEHTVLLAGEPDELNEKIPQAENLNAFPTTFIVARDGRVRSIHAGFPSPGSGEFYTRAEREVTELIERLLGEKESRR
jgi:thiol-disulfide isomerase/thioredoxin